MGFITQDWFDRTKKVLLSTAAVLATSLAVDVANDTARSQGLGSDAPDGVSARCRATVTGTPSNLLSICEHEIAELKEARSKATYSTSNSKAVHDRETLYDQRIFEDENIIYLCRKALGLNPAPLTLRRQGRAHARSTGAPEPRFSRASSAATNWSGQTVSPAPTASEGIDFTVESVTAKIKVPANLELTDGGSCATENGVWQLLPWAGAGGAGSDESHESSSRTG